MSKKTNTYIVANQYGYILEKITNTRKYADVLAHHRWDYVYGGKSIFIGTKAQYDRKKFLPLPAIVTSTMPPKQRKRARYDLLAISDVLALWDTYHIGCKNTETKDSYRIMAGGSSMHVRPSIGYRTYVTNEDFENIRNSHIVADDLELLEDDNIIDKNRPHTVICTTVPTLQRLLEVFASNPHNIAVSTANTETA